MKIDLHFIIFLLIGYLLSLIGFSTFFIQGVKEVFNKDVTNATYYLTFFLVGLIFDLIQLLRTK
jgi:hypothetical protein